MQRCLWRKELPIGKIDCETSTYKNTGVVLVFILDEVRDAELIQLGALKMFVQLRPRLCISSVKKANE